MTYRWSTSTSYKPLLGGYRNDVITNCANRRWVVRNFLAMSCPFMHTHIPNFHRTYLYDGRLQRVQNNAARLITRTSKHVPTCWRSCIGCRLRAESPSRCWELLINALIAWRRLILQNLFNLSWSFRGHHGVENNEWIGVDDGLTYGIWLNKSAGEIKCKSAASSPKDWILRYIKIYLFPFTYLNRANVSKTHYTKI